MGRSSCWLFPLIGVSCPAEIRGLLLPSGVGLTAPTIFELLVKLVMVSSGLVLLPACSLLWQLGLNNVCAMVTWTQGKILLSDVLPLIVMLGGTAWLVQMGNISPVCYPTDWGKSSGCSWQLVQSDVALASSETVCGLPFVSSQLATQSFDYCFSEGFCQTSRLLFLIWLK